ncbi:thiol-disulfide oxidoreductase ResA [Clostridium puniceum]|uniref:Thiol-disulfide oxidoreductase ResA n=1 Tax=Clostridium puniceum TaxID=29367 RepID=A0A1S8THU0_9CLOT|nr:TlpA disulfide reductase family protein [Clostridium puniceum]OOM77370.1 thiol-disulfide oxidoreductase ResA [Clostridium puniceum]
MNNNKKLIILVVGFLTFSIFLVAAYLGYGTLAYKYNNKNIINESEKSQNQNSKNNKLKVKLKAKDFTIYDENLKEVKLSDYIGTPVVLNFWASWCPPCKEEMPGFNEMSKKYSKEKIAILMINLTDGEQETTNKAQKYIKSNNYDMKLLFDTKLDAANKYNITSIPRTIFIDKDGYIFKDNPAGVLSKEELESQIELLLQA